MIPLKRGLFEYKDQIKQMGGKWNGHVWCVPPDVDYNYFIKYLPDEIKERINCYKEYDSVGDDMPPILFGWQMFKSLASASLKLIIKEINRNHILADDTYSAVTEFVREIEWAQIERAILALDVSRFKPIPIANKKEKYYPRGILLWSEQISGEVGFSDIYKESSFYATDKAHEVYLSDELEFVCTEIDGKEFYSEQVFINTSRILVNELEEKEDILIEFISALLDYGQDFTQEFLKKMENN